MIAKTPVLDRPSNEGSETERRLLERLDREVGEIRAEIEGGGRYEHPSLKQRLSAIEGEQKLLKKELEAQESERKSEKRARKAFVAGLSMLGVLSALILGLMYRVLQILAGGV